MHSKSPSLHNAAFQKIGIDAIYTRLAAENAEEALQIANEIGMAGLNVTAPFKETMVPLMDSLDKSAEQTRAVNTILLKNGKTLGHNTDGIGVVRALENSGLKLLGKKVVVLGAGGAAKAAVFGLVSAGAEIIIANRTCEKAEEMAKRFGCESSRLDQLTTQLKNADALVSCVSSGERVVESSALHSDLTVLDAVYAEETALTTDAKRSGCKIVSGTEWLLFQALEAFKLFTGKAVPIEVMRNALAETHPTTNNLALIGFMGSGKTSTAKAISKKSKMALVDMDSTIENTANARIKEIIETQGEPAFREMENKETERLHNYDNTVIACGGGTVLNPTNRKLLRKKCKTIWLWVKPEEIHNRTKHDSSRPLLNAPDRQKAIHNLLEKRIGIYASCADLVVGTEGKTPEETAEVIIHEIHKTR